MRSRKIIDWPQIGMVTVPLSGDEITLRICAVFFVLTSEINKYSNDIVMNLL